MQINDVQEAEKLVRVAVARHDNTREICRIDEEKKEKVLCATCAVNAASQRGWDLFHTGDSGGIREYHMRKSR